MTSEGVVGVMQPFLTIEPTDSMTKDEEAGERKAFTAGCERDALTGERLLLVRIERELDDRPATLEAMHLACSHAFEVPQPDGAGIHQVSKLVRLPVIYQFRHHEALTYRGVITEDLDAEGDLDRQGAELWVSRYGRSRRPKSHINAMVPVS